MTSGRYGLAWREVGRLFGGESASGLGAGPLLERFAADRDSAAFEALVSRHGPMVFATCRRMLSDPHDADDAFQATFLVLARKAGSIRDPDRLGPWLHGVARRVAARSRALAGRRRSVERPVGDEPAGESPDPLEGAEVRAVLDEELARLPEKYRAPLVLCYLDGLTHDEAAEALRWPVGTVRSRLAGGRDRLRARLSRRGLSPSAAAPLVLAHASIPQALLTATVRAATSAGLVPARILALTKGALIAMTWSKLKGVAALGLMAGMTVGGAGVAAQYGGSGVAAPKAEPPARPDELSGLQGRWSLVGREPDLGNTFGRDAVWTIEGKSLVATEKGEPWFIGELVLGDEGSVKTFDIVVPAPKDEPRPIFRCLYRLEGDGLVVCSGDVDGPRPTAFRPSNSGTFPAVYRFQRQPAVAKADEKSTKVLDPFEVEAMRLRAEEAKLTKQIHDIETVHKNELSSLRKAAANNSDEQFELSQRWKQHKAEAATTAVDDRIKRLAAELETSRVETSDLRQKLDALGNAVARPIPEKAATKAAASSKPADNSRPKPTNPMIMSLGGERTLLIPPEQDRATVLDNKTGVRATHRFPLGVIQILPVVGPVVATPGVVALILKGPEVRQVAVYLSSDGKWYPQDLQEPTTEASPIFGPQQVAYSLGRFLYMFSTTAKKWGVLELKADPGKGANVYHEDGNSGDSKTAIAEGDMLYIYDPRTGDWTHINTKDDQ